MSCGARMRRRCAGHRAGGGGGGGGGGVGGCTGTGTVGATVWDDYFDCGTILDTAGARFTSANAWTKYNDGGSAYSQASGLLSTNHTGGPFIAYQTLPAGTAWAFRAKVRVNFHSGGFPAAGIVLRESATDKMTAAVGGPSGSDIQSAVRLYTNVSTWTTNIAGGNITNAYSVPAFFWVEVERAGANITYRYSADNSTYSTITAARAVTTDFTTAPDQVGLLWNGSALQADYDTFWRQS